MFLIADLIIADDFMVFANPGQKSASSREWIIDGRVDTPAVEEAVRDVGSILKISDDLPLIVDVVRKRAMNRRGVTKDSSRTLAVIKTNSGSEA